MPEGLLRFITTCAVFGGSIVMLVQTIWIDQSSKEQSSSKDGDLVSL